MPCDIASSLRGGCRAVFGLKFFNTIFSSTLWTGFLITVMVAIFLIVMVPVESDTPTWILFKFMFYTFMSSIGILFLHNNIVKISEDEGKGEKESKELLERMGGAKDEIPDADDVEVKPDITSTIGAEERVFQHYGI
jgi:hypothetical protein